MRVIFAINSLGAGGAERSLTEFLAVSGSAIEPVIACLEGSEHGVGQDATDLGIRVRIAGGGGLGRWVPWLRRQIADVRPDLVHTTLFEADVAGRLAATGSGVPVVTSLVNTTYDPIRFADPNVAAWKLRSALAIDAWTARRLTTHFHAITGAVRDAAVQALRIDQSRVTVIERGRDPDRLGSPGATRRLRARRALGLASDALTLVTLGRQEFQKGQWHLIDAMPKVLASFPDAQLLISGREGNASDRLRMSVQSAGLEASVRFLGHRRDAPEILAASDLFVFPSLYEGLGGALIEAMALGLPIVTSDLPAIREVVESGRNALLVPPGASDDLAASILELAPDLERRVRMGDRSRAIFDERFTLERSAQRMVALFERVAAEGRHPRR